MEFLIGRELTAEIRRLGRDTGTTLYMICLAAFDILLSRLSGQEDIVVASPSAGRHHGDLQNIVGMFVNTLVMRNQPAGEKTLRGFLEEVKTESLKVFEAQDYQYEELINRLGVQKDGQLVSLFNTMFSITNFDMPELHLDGLKIKPYVQESTISEHDLMLALGEEAGTIAFTIQYKIRLFKAESIKKTGEAYIEILREMTQNPDKRIEDIEI